MGDELGEIGSIVGGTVVGDSVGLCDAFSDGGDVGGVGTALGCLEGTGVGGVGVGVVGDRVGGIDMKRIGNVFVAGGIPSSMDSACQRSKNRYARTECTLSWVAALPEPWCHLALPDQEKVQHQQDRLVTLLRCSI